jgi:hypothetical protein
VSSEVIVTDPKTGAKKGSKLARYDLLPPGPLHAVAEHYGRGAEKYEDRNWEKGYDWGLSFAALNRHLWAMWDGEWIDEETGSPHLAAVVFHAFALMEFHDKGLGTDSRSWRDEGDIYEGYDDPPEVYPEWKDVRESMRIGDESFLEWQRRITEKFNSPDPFGFEDRRHHLDVWVTDGSTVETSEYGYRVNLSDWHEWEDHGGEG